MATNSDISSALIPIYSTPQINQPILLYQGAMEIQIDSQKIATGKGNICLNWLPSPGIKVEISSVRLDVSVEDFRSKALGSEVQLLLGDSEIKTSASLNRFTCSPDVNVEDFWRIDVSGILNETIWSESSESLEYILGNLVNFPRLRGKMISYSQNNGINMAASRVVLRAENWEIIIDGVGNINKIIEELSCSGGYAITSILKIQHSSSGSISLKDTKDIIEALCFFLSFAIGNYSPIILPMGFNSSSIQSWYKWEDWLIPQWEKTATWFSGERNCDSLTEVFPGFMKIWNNSDSIWRETIRRSIFWYVESHRIAIDPSGRIIWIQAALELLSWTYFVGTGRMPEECFKKLGGMCEKMKAFLNDLKIPTSFSNSPTGLQYLEKFIENHKEMWIQKEVEYLKKKNRNTDDINYEEVAERNLEIYLYLKAFVEIRNDIVHPKQSSGIILSPDDSDYEYSFWVIVGALNLGLWYLELSLLYLFEHQGSYVNRLSGKLEIVPWADV